MQYVRGVKKPVFQIEYLARYLFLFFQVVDPEHERKFEELKGCTKPVECPNGEEKFHYEESIGMYT